MSWLLLTKLLPSSVVPDCRINGSSVNISCTKLTASYGHVFGINDSFFVAFEQPTIKRAVSAAAALLPPGKMKATPARQRVAVSSDVQPVGAVSI